MCGLQIDWLLLRGADLQGEKMINRFGTSSDMIIQTVEEAGKTLCLAIDVKGLYLTSEDRIDTGLADNNRFASDRRLMHSRIEKLGLSPDALISANKHLIQTESSLPVQKINPLKASKRQARG